MSFCSPAVIIWPGMSSKDSETKRDIDVENTFKVCAYLLRKYCEWSASTTEEEKKAKKFHFLRDDLKYVQILANREARNYVRKYVNLLENFDVVDRVKRTNLYCFYQLLNERMEGVAIWRIIGHTRSFIDFNSIISEMTKEDFDLFEESIQYQEIVMFSKRLVKEHPDVSLDV